RQFGGRHWRGLRRHHDGVPDHPTSGADRLCRHPNRPLWTGHWLGARLPGDVHQPAGAPDLSRLHRARPVRRDLRPLPAPDRLDAAADQPARSHPRAFPAGQPAGHRQRVGLRTRPIASADHRPKLCGDNRGRAIMTRIGIIALAAAGLVAGAASAQDAALRQAVQADYEANLGALFDHFHRNPELSGLEAMTAARIATELRALGYETTTGVGGHGVVAVLRNGEGPTVMLRADMDGLPLEEIGRASCRGG